MPTHPSKNLDTFPNPNPDRDYIIEIVCPEFTCLCPKTGQPDFAVLTLEYVPDRLCVELKSLKLYIWSYRDEGHFHEDVTNRIFNDLVAVMRPRYLRLRAKFNVRGGLYTTIEVEHRQPGWKKAAPPPVDLPRETQNLPGKDMPPVAPFRTTPAKHKPIRSEAPPPPEEPPVDFDEPAEPEVRETPPPAHARTSPPRPRLTRLEPPPSQPPPPPKNPVPLTSAPRAKSPSTPASVVRAVSERFRKLQRTYQNRSKPEEAEPIEPETPGNTVVLLRSRQPEPAPVPEEVIEAEAPPETVETPPEPPPKVKQEGIYIGIDLGTSGCRAIAVNDAGDIQGEAAAPVPTPNRKNDEVTQDPMIWWKAVNACLENLLKQIDPQRARAVTVDGTSGTLLLCDAKGSPVTPAIMYNDQRAVKQAETIASHADKDSGAQGPGSSLAKLMWLHDRKLDKRARHALHQADWISNRLTGKFGHSDYNNCLKLGYDAGKMAWPKWFSKLGFDADLLPEVHAPGEPLGNISSDIARRFGLPEDVEVLAGTTDGVASFLAAGPTEPGHAVTALGSTLVLKLLSNKPVFSGKHGVYSHRLGKYWLAGGASNSGGAVLLQYFKVEQMQEMTPLLDPNNLTGLDYYPLPDIGERFPINNPEMAPRLEPLPGSSVTFFQGMLEGIARVELQGYELLKKLGAPAVSRVYTTGGGSQNLAWEQIRANILKVKMNKPRSGHAAYGSALLATGVVAKTFQ